ncbi:nitrate- and nitrite sensing domain-containing protein [Kitasatospora sp. NBC_01287]|uniref:sensor histidine kinase n=1 Tax=Kitasatospora sp. NBC_01287 TaxID=2903573 RepID=UPI00224F0886|nr:nitrate- and nitrite sensing domain-containing protein [Kitasatospora sp. NBC_01287]MCX4750647.1 nitrate- and nitrite sensing domain-containing protein [Kitasatospora sp. NBC_01287]
MSLQIAAPHEENALRARGASKLRKTSRKTSKNGRSRLTLRTALLVLAIVPSIALTALWAVTTGQTLSDFQRQAAQGMLAQKAGQPTNIVYYNLQEERRLSAQQLAQPGSVTDQLARQRQSTDDAVRTFLNLSKVTDSNASTEVRGALDTTRTALGRLAQQRTAVDQGKTDQETTFSYYTDAISDDLALLTAIGHVDNGEVSYISRVLVQEFWAEETISREDAILARGWPSGKLSALDLASVQQLIGAQALLYKSEILPFLPPKEAAAAQQLTNGSAWQTKVGIEQLMVLKPAAANADGTIPLPPVQAQWRQSVDLATPQLVSLLQTRSDSVVATGKSAVRTLLLRVVLTSVIGLIAVIAVIITSWRLTRSLRRRIVDLQGQAVELERTLPELVDRLGRGEQVAPEQGSREVSADPAGGDELSRLGQALDLARHSAVTAAVGQAEQHRGFERLLQRIARRTQLLIGLQLKTLDEMERKHEDPEVLEGLFDLDHLTARLRRYEENLVILAGGQPQRRWRKPVPLLDVLRAAQGEVQDYRRILIDIEGTPWLSERAVGPVVHVLAELMENAAAFSKPPTPVEVRAAMVGRGLAVEIEDRGLGMETEQLDAANGLMRRPPRLDVLAQAEDIRLGLYVVARLADTLGLRVEFRASAFGGTRAVVLIPGELVTSGPVLEPVLVEAGALPSRVRGRTLPAEPAAVRQPLPPAAAPASAPVPAPESAPAVRPSWAASATDHERTAETVQPPLPQRVRQASLAAELRIPPTSADQGPTPGDPAEVPPPAPTRSGAAIGAFQRRSRAARLGDESTGELTPIPTSEDPS